MILETFIPPESRFRVMLTLAVGTLVLTFVLLPVYNHSSTQLAVIPAAISSAFGFGFALATIRLSSRLWIVAGWVLAFLHVAFLTKFIWSFYR